MTVSAQHNDMANAIRALSMDAVEAANSGHPGMPMGMADVATVLFTRFLKYDPKQPLWPDRDRFVLSAGHGSMLLYSVLYLLGVEDASLDELKHFRQLGHKTAGHPEVGHLAGVESTTGPLGQGLAMSVGMALAERILNAEFGDGVVSHRTYVIAGDGCLMEGISHEAIHLAGHLRLKNLIVFWDDNGISIDGPVSLSESGDQIKRFEAAGWETMRIDGHDPAQIEAAIEAAQKNDKPTMIACKTIIGFGAPTKAGTEKVHGAALGKDELAGAKKALGWAHEPFVVPSEILDAWRVAGLEQCRGRKEWEKRFAALDPEKRAEFDRRVRGDLPGSFKKAMMDFKRQFVADKPNIASRKSSEMVIGVIADMLPEAIGGSADLTHSNFTRAKSQLPVTRDNYGGHYVFYGIREFGMSAAMNGMALHGGIIPYGGTFLVFTDYARPAIRLSALMGRRVVYVMTHDSIGLGEDGPTHQPVEHLAALRAIPNLLVFRPADAVETLEAWEIALETKGSPSILALSRQNLTPLRTEMTEENRVARGAYEISPADGEAEVTIFATGSEVMLAVEAQKRLAAEGHPTRVVSVPCFELFEAQSEAYKAEVIGSARLRVAVEAAISMGWDRFIGEAGIFIGMTGFGASGKADDLYKHFGITADALVEKALARLRSNH
jgi:transketolase